jgi:hypothetical protein
MFRGLDLGHDKVALGLFALLMAGAVAHSIWRGEAILPPYAIPKAANARAYYIALAFEIVVLSCLVVGLFSR